MKSKLCLSCAHTKVCFLDKNVVGDIFVPGHPMFFDNDELFKQFEERKAAGFPCDNYMAIGKITAGSTPDASSVTTAYNSEANNDDHNN